MADNKYNGIERYIFADVYNFFLKYKDMPNEDYYWENCLNDSQMLYFKYKNNPFARAMLSSTINQLEAKITGKLQAGLTYEQWDEQLKLAKKMGW